MRANRVVVVALAAVLALALGATLTGCQGARVGTGSVQRADVDAWATDVLNASGAASASQLAYDEYPCPTDPGVFKTTKQWRHVSRVEVTSEASAVAAIERAFTAKTWKATRSGGRAAGYNLRLKRAHGRDHGVIQVTGTGSGSTPALTVTATSACF